ncbi:hypothetical protein [Bradyrhizobium sp. SSUT77]|uniref:hypothetical protein n=1 Tax=Bradyrhizobium sp. SSUT77 TaxID=3040603 RepID=UPI0024487E43|nr:hypothetical protein [Bradyrhizobium sp. SSUT77]MDH2343425.1 hypothetical protein [Bradyrhizobium sp. SSUT77]
MTTTTLALRRTMPLLRFPLLMWGAFSLEAVGMATYFLRDDFSAAARYYLYITHLSPLWFVPDAFGFMCLFLFIYRCIIQNRSILAVVVLLWIFLSLGIGYLFLGNVTAFASAFKMILPVFIGFSFCDADTAAYKKLLLLMSILFYVSIFGVILSAYWKAPWVNYTYEAFGVKRQAGRLWWAGSEQRLSGFCEDSTVVSLFILVAYVMTSIRKNVWWCLFFGGAAFYALKLTTSKTTMGVLAMYLIALLVIRAMPEKMRFPTLRMLAVSSYLSILVPIFLILVFGGTSVGAKDFLFSLVDRINNSWQKPFIFLSQLMPVGYITGCGVGCFNYPMNQFSNLTSYWVPVDNFYLVTFLMFGVPFVAFMFFVIRATLLTTDIYKLSLTFVMNIFSITVADYGPASGLLLMSFIFSDVFSRRASFVFQGGKSNRRYALHANPPAQDAPALGGAVPRLSGSG